ncbi:MAG: HD domain-containing protein [Pseudomonadota bacterium]
MQNDLIENIRSEAKSFFEESSGCHDWSHVERVRNIAIRIGTKENARLDIIEIAALLHDIARPDEMNAKGEFCHAKEGASRSVGILKKYDISDQDMQNIIHCIETHRFRSNNPPKTLEAKVLFDADKMDAIGAVGIGRNFLFAGSAGANRMYTGKEKDIAEAKVDYAYTDDDTAIMEYEAKLKHLKGRMLTKAGKEMAEVRHKFMEEFFNRFWGEVSGDI